MLSISELSKSDNIVAIIIVLHPHVLSLFVVPDFVSSCIWGSLRPCVLQHVDLIRGRLSSAPVDSEVAVILKAADDGRGGDGGRARENVEALDTSHETEKKGF